MLSRAKRLWRDNSALSVVEFALMLPIVMTLGMYGIEMAMLSTTNLLVSQIAMSTADNASRMVQGSSSAVTPTITPTMVSSILTGAVKEGGSLNLATNGKVILSSLEMNSSNQQVIRWQRCTGSYSAQSAYGIQGAVVTGMGPTAGRVTAASGTAVMYVEVYYRKTGLFGSLFVRPMIFHQEAAFLIRDNRNIAAGLSGTTNC